VTWVAQYAPHHASFVPVYASPPKTPHSLNTGTQYKLDKESNYWIHCLTGNYLSRWYIHTIGSVQLFQRQQEAFVFARQAEAEAVAVKLLPKSVQGAVASLGQFHELMGKTLRDAWWDFFFLMASTYRDMYVVDMPHEENFALAFSYLTVPRWWFEQIGYWGAPGTPPKDDPVPRPIHPINVPSASQSDYAEKYPKRMSYVYPSPFLQSAGGSNGGVGAAYLGPASVAALSLAVGAAIGALGMLWFQKNRGVSGGSYLPIN